MYCELTKSTRVSIMESTLIKCDTFLTLLIKILYKMIKREALAIAGAYSDYEQTKLKSS